MLGRSFFLKIAGLATILFMTNQGVFGRMVIILDQARPAALLLFIGLWGISVAAVFITAFHKRLWIRLFWATVITLGTIGGYAYFRLSGSQLTVFDVVSLWSARHEADKALLQYSSELIWLLPLIIAQFILLVLPPPAMNRLTEKVVSWFFWLPAVPVILIITIIYLKSGGGTQALPIQFSTTAMAAVTAMQSMKHRLPDRVDVSLTPEQKPAVKHVVYLVDESIRPDYLNFSPDNPQTPNLAKLKSRIADFGQAISAGNCSHYSNAILRLGGTRQNLIESMQTSPSIWQYAKKAGFHTIYIDAQARHYKLPGKFQNFMTINEAEYIDEIYSLDNEVTSSLDFELLELLKDKLDSTTPYFIYANKNGAHFPYDNAYPTEAKYFTPTQSDRKGMPDELEGVKNSYRNAIRWSVDQFFQQFFAENDLRNTAVIYTSDHGQYFADGVLTHCTTKETKPEEGIVPLLFISDNQDLQTRFKKSAHFNYNQTDHFAIFPTLLALFGFATDDIEKRYGHGLLDHSKAYSTFSTGDIFGLFNQTVNWIEVERPLNNKRLYAGKASGL